MKALFSRGALAPLGAGLLLAGALGLAGCAMLTAQGEPEVTARVAAAEPPPTERQAAPAKPNQTVAAAKKPSTHTLAAREPAPRQAASRGEADCTGVEICASVLKAMVANPDRSWLHRPAAPAVLANGVRLFAYRTLRSDLACGELAAALSEVEAAARTFSAPVAGLQPGQLRRVKSLSVEVGAELQDETARRCAPQGKDAPIGSIAPPPRG